MGERVSERKSEYSTPSRPYNNNSKRTKTVLCFWQRHHHPSRHHYEGLLRDSILTGGYST